MGPNSTPNISSTISSAARTDRPPSSAVSHWKSCQVLYARIAPHSSAVTNGAITMSTLNGGRTLGSDDLAYAEELARIASLAIENARLYRRAKDGEQDAGESPAAG